MFRFYHPGPYLVHGRVKLDPEQSHHLNAVLRLKISQVVLLIDGNGKSAQAVIHASTPKRAALEILAVHEEDNRSNIRLCFAIPKPKAIDFLFHRCTEIGIGGFQPIVSVRSGALAQWNQARWVKVLAEVCKQCESAHFPKCYPPKGLATWLDEREASRTLILCSETDRCASLAPISGKIDILIGPEGGWTEQELTTIISKGASKLGLGKNRLRSETAALVSLILVKQKIQEW